MRCVKGPAKDSTWRRPRIRLHANSGALGISLSPEDWHLCSMEIGMKSSGTLGKSESVGGERGSRMGEDSGGDEDGRAVNAGHTLLLHYPLSIRQEPPSRWESGWACWDV